MSRVPYTIDVDRFICYELDDIRKMNENRDYSGLASRVERIQRHASAMEEALYRYDGIKHRLTEKINNDKIDDKKFREITKEILKDLEVK